MLTMRDKKILAAVICCDYKEETLSECVKHIRNAGFDVVVNFESEGYPMIDWTSPDNETEIFCQGWIATGHGFNPRKFDQDQNSRLTRICIARNMVMDFFQQTDYDYLLFVDSDVMIPADTYEHLFGQNWGKAVLSGLVPGRGVHAHAQYLFGPIAKHGNRVEVEYATCGFLAIPRDLVFRTRFRWGLPANGGVICSEDPIFGDDIRTIHGYKWLVFTDCKAQHLGDLKEGETSQF